MPLQRPERMPERHFWLAVNLKTGDGSRTGKTSPVFLFDLERFYCEIYTKTNEKFVQNRYVFHKWNGFDKRNDIGHFHKQRVVLKQ